MGARRNKASKTAREQDLLRTLCARQDNRCYWCGGIMVRSVFRDHRTGKVMEDPAKATIDHVVALGANGATDDKNCVAACYKCNQLRSSFNAGVIQRRMQELNNRNHDLQVELIAEKDLVGELQDRIVELLHKPCGCYLCRADRWIQRLAGRLVVYLGVDEAIS